MANPSPSAPPPGVSNSLAYAIRMCSLQALNSFEEWLDVTGAIAKESSWKFELDSIIEDAVKIGFFAGAAYEAHISSTPPGTDGRQG